MQGVCPLTNFGVVHQRLPENFCLLFCYCRWQKMKYHKIVMNYTGKSYPCNVLIKINQKSGRE